MATRVTDGARRDALVSRVSRLRRLRARALPSLNLKKKKDCSQWFGSHFNVGVTLRLLLSARVSSLVIEYRSDDVIKMKFVKLWDLLSYCERTTSKQRDLIRNKNNRIAACWQLQDYQYFSLVKLNINFISGNIY